MLPPLRAPFKKSVKAKYMDVHKTEEELEQDDEEEEEEDPDYAKKRAEYKKRLKEVEV